ncbi:DNA replication/repair protein RecF [Polycladidibacter hongkongensis]|uniref:DNA replication/repair protein RecF n=1 Tax=Polycladidibacter hongkongensis TaxID=1647556 RepID=UPI00082F15FA|nr:DNA replication/repair protein RecF [Pseudovibrio hongkongensis]
MTERARVALTRLVLSDFRNYTNAKLELDSDCIALTGHNGAGKTNILEALSLLSAGRGFRRAILADIGRIGGSGGWAISALLDGPYGETKLGTGLTAGDTGRRLRIDGEEARSSDALLDHLRVLWLVPAMDCLFTGSASDRRKFLDRLVLSINPAHGRIVGDYEKALRQRNRLLVEGGSNAYLDAVEAQVADLGTAVALARNETVTLLVDTLARHAVSEAAFPASLISLQGPFEELVHGVAAADLEDRFKAQLRDNRLIDRAAGRTLTGPHRSDLSVLHADKELPAAYASTGEQKALLIGLVLAHAELTGAVSGMAPVLLLDEVAAHLDPDRRAALFTRLQELGGQVFMTGTDTSLFEALPPEAQFFTVHEGSVSVTNRSSG